jgi:hypothetical protein
MGIIAKNSGNGGDFASLPPGVQPALCVDVVDLGEQETPFLDAKGQKKRAHKIILVWQVEAYDEEGNKVEREDGKPWLASKFYTLSLNEKAILRQDLDSWRGKAFTDEELELGFDVEKLLHVPCQLLLVVSKNKAGKEFMAVQSVMAKHRNDPLITPWPEFVREKDKPGGKDTRSPKEGGRVSQPQSAEEDEDLDLPF